MCCCWRLSWSVSALGGTTAASGRELLREVRASFYRKLFLAFLAASVAAGDGAGVRHAHVFRSCSCERASSPTPSASRPWRSASSRNTWRCRQRDAGAAPERRHHGVAEPRDRAGREHLSTARTLLATSERDLFDSGLLPERTPGPVYRAIELDRLSSHVGEEVVGAVPHMLAAAPVRRRRRARDSHRAARAAAAGSRPRDRHARPPRAARGAAVRAAWRGDRLLHGRAHRRSGESAHARHAPHRARRLQRAGRGDLIRRAAPARRRLQSDGGRSPAPARRAASGRIGWKRGPKWRGRWRTRSRIR